MKFSKEIIKRSLNKVFIFFKEDFIVIIKKDFIPFLKGIDNFYMKFILTVIAFSLLYIADDIHDFNNTIHHGYISVSAGVSGDINTEVSGDINANVSNNFDNGY